MINCYYPLINFIIFIAGFIFLGIGLYNENNKMINIGTILIIGILIYICYLSGYDIPLCN